MKYCPRCGAQLEDDATKCDVCGVSFITQNKLAYILSLVSTILVCISFHWIVSCISIVIAITAIVFAFVKKAPMYTKITLGLSIFSIIGSILIIIFNFL